METNFKEILLLGLSKSKLARVEFWEYHQSKSYNSESVFLHELFQALFYYNDLIEGQIAEAQAWGNEGIKDFFLPLGPETGMKLTGHLGKQAVSDLAESLLEYQKKNEKKAIDLETKKTEAKKNQDDELTHRVHILANVYKAEVGIEELKTPAQWAKERGERARQQASTVCFSKNAKRYKEPNIKELTQVIELLKEWPQAQKIAINKKAQQEKL